MENETLKIFRPLVYCEGKRDRRAIRNLLVKCLEIENDDFFNFHLEDEDVYIRKHAIEQKDVLDAIAIFNKNRKKYNFLILLTDGDNRPDRRKNIKESIRSTSTYFLEEYCVLGVCVPMFESWLLLDKNAVSIVAPGCFRGRNRDLFSDDKKFLEYIYQEYIEDLEIEDFYGLIVDKLNLDTLKRSDRYFALFNGDLIKTCNFLKNEKSDFQQKDPDRPTEWKYDKI